MKFHVARGDAPFHLTLLRYAGVFGAVLIVVSCATTPVANESGIGGGAAAANLSPIVEESLKNIGIASPRTLLQAETALGESTSGYSDYGLELSYVVYKMIEILYPLYLQPEYVIYPPAASVFPDLFRQVQNGKYASVSQSDVSFLTLIIPPMAVLYTDSPGVIESSLEALDHAETLNPSSVLPPYLKGVIARKRGNDAIALSEFEQALAKDSSCYPAAIDAARILISEKRYREAGGFLESLLSSIPPDAEVYRLHAEVRYQLGFDAEAERAIARALQLAPKSTAALLLSARINQAQKQYAKALDDLNKLEKLESPTPQVVLMRAELQQSAGDLAAAIETLAAAVKSFPDSRELSDAYGRALVAAGRTAAATKYLPDSLAQSPGGAESLERLVTDAIAAKSWKVAEAYVSRLLELKSSEQTLNQAYEIYDALGERAKTLEYAHKLHEVAPADPRYLLDYVRSLIASGRLTEARAAIDRGLAAGGGPQTLSSLYYERSRTQTDPANELQDLRSALLENLENESALVAISRYYLTRGDLSSARRYAAEAEVFLPQGEKLPDDLSKLLSASE